MEEIRIVVVGDERCGKTSLIPRFISDTLPASYKPTSFDKFLVTKDVSGCLYSLTVWDTSGSANFDTVRPLSYGEADVFIICFKVRVSASAACPSLLIFVDQRPAVSVQRQLPLAARDP